MEVMQVDFFRLKKKIVISILFPIQDGEKAFKSSKILMGWGKRSFPHSSSQWECYRKLHWALDRALRVYQRFCQPH